SEQDSNDGYINLTLGTTEGEAMLDHNGQPIPLSVENHRHFGAVNKKHYHKVKVVVDIKDHSHPTKDIVIKGHNHKEVYGAFDIEGSMATDMNVYINDVKVNATPLNGECELNITNYLVKNKLNEVKITSETIGSIYWHCYTRSFIKW
ncbi:MAG: hypothetical protein ACRDD7_18325, partial [Peptostreptococcaceae bacterium]